MNLQESGEMYLETIHVLSKEKSAVRAIDIVDYMGYSKPSVSRAMKLLREDEYIIVDKDGHITLTDKGIAIAEKIYERHTILAEVLTRIGVPKEIAASDACKIEHIISDETFEALKKHAGSHK